MNPVDSQNIPPVYNGKASRNSTEKKTDALAKRLAKKEKEEATQGFWTRKFVKEVIDTVQTTANANFKENEVLLKQTIANFDNALLHTNVEKYFPFLENYLPQDLLKLLKGKEQEAKNASKALSVYILANLIRYTYPKQDQKSLTFEQFVSDFSIKFTWEFGEELAKIESSHYNQLVQDSHHFNSLAEKLLFFFLPDNRSIKGGILVSLVTSLVNVREKIKKKLAEALKEKWNTFVIKQSTWLMEDRFKSETEEKWRSSIPDLEMEKLYSFVFNFLPEASQKALIRGEGQKNSLKSEAFYLLKLLYEYAFTPLPEAPIPFEALIASFQAKLASQLESKERAFQIDLYLTPKGASQEEKNFIFECSRTFKQLSELFFKEKRKDFIAFAKQISCTSLETEETLEEKFKEHKDELAEFFLSVFANQSKKKSEEYFRKVTGDEKVLTIVYQLADPIYRLILKNLPQAILEFAQSKESLSKHLTNALLLQLFKNISSKIFEKEPADEKIPSEDLAKQVTTYLLDMIKTKFDHLNKKDVETLSLQDFDDLSKELLILALPAGGFIRSFIGFREKMICKDISTSLLEFYKSTRPKASDLETYKQKLRVVFWDKKSLESQYKDIRIPDQPDESVCRMVNLEPLVEQVEALSRNLALNIKKIFVDQLKTRNALKKQLFDLLAQDKEDSFQELAHVIQGIVSADNTDYNWIDSQLQKTLEQALFKGIVRLLEKTTKGEVVPPEKILTRTFQYLLKPCVEKFPLILNSFPKTSYQDDFQDLISYGESLKFLDDPIKKERQDLLQQLVHHKKVDYNIWAEEILENSKGLKFENLSQKILPGLKKLDLTLPEDEQETVLQEVLTSFSQSTVRDSYSKIFEKLYEHLVDADLIYRLKQANFSDSHELVKMLKESSDQEKTMLNYLNKLQFEEYQQVGSKEERFDFLTLLPKLKILDPKSANERFEKIFTEVKQSYEKKLEQAVTEEAKDQLLAETYKNLFLEVFLEKENRTLQERILKCLKKIPENIVSESERQKIMRSHDFKSYLKEISEKVSHDDRQKVMERLVNHLSSIVIMQQRQNIAQTQFKTLIEDLLGSVFDGAFEDYLPLHPKIKSPIASLIVDQLAAVLSQFFVVSSHGILEIPKARTELKKIYGVADPQTYGEDNPGNLARAGFLASQMVGPGFAYACREAPDKLIEGVGKILAPLCELDIENTNDKKKMSSLLSLVKGLIDDLGNAYHKESPHEYRSLFTFMNAFAEGFILKTFIDLTNRLAEKEKLIPQDHPSLLEQELKKTIQDATTHCQMINATKKAKPDGNPEYEDYISTFRQHKALRGALQEGMDLKKYTESVSPKMLALLDLKASSLPVPSLFQDVFFELFEQTITPLGLEKVFEVATDTTSWNQAIIALIRQIEKKSSDQEINVKSRVIPNDQYQIELQSEMTQLVQAIIEFQPSLLLSAVKNKRALRAVGKAIAMPLREFIRPEVEKPLKIQDLLSMLMDVVADKLHKCAWDKEKQEFRFLSEEGEELDQPDFSLFLPDGEEEKTRVEEKRAKDRQEVLRSVPRGLERLVNRETDKRVNELYEFLWKHVHDMVNTIIDQTFAPETQERAKKYIHKILDIVLGIPLKILHVLFRVIIWLPLRHFVKIWVKKQTHKRAEDVNKPIHANFLYERTDRIFKKA